jgi:hypothetical protein
MKTLAASRRSRRILLWMARLALVVYVGQIMAFDHWHADASQIVGVVGSDAHVLHCHGDAAGCADGAGGLSGTLAEGAMRPVMPPAVPRAAASVTIAFAEALIPTPDYPPRAAGA